MSDSDDERIAYLSGDAGSALSATDRAELNELRALLSSAEAWEEPAPGLEERVVATIVEQAAARPRAAPARARGRRPWWEWLGLRRRAYGLVSAAAAVAAVAVVVFVVAVNGSSNSTLRFAMVVSGTPLAPDAHGSAALTKTTSGWRIELRASGLPDLTNGRYYEAWLKNPAGILVPVGTFNDARNVTLWSGVPVTQFRAFTVTQQRVGGTQVSSGRRVLIGTAHPVG